MRRCTYTIATHKGHEPQKRNGYLMPITASCGTVVNLALVKLNDEWFGDHAATGYAIGNLRAPTRSALIELIESIDWLADKCVETARGRPIINPDYG